MKVREHYRRFSKRHGLEARSISRRRRQDRIKETENSLGLKLGRIRYVEEKEQKETFGFLIVSNSLRFDGLWIEAHDCTIFVL